MNVFSKTEELRRAALDYLWMHNRGWIDMAEQGEPVIMVEGDGMRVKDSEGRTWIDPNGGYVSVNVGYGRTEIAEAAREQMQKLSFQPPGAATEPLIRVSEKIAEIAPGSMERVYPVNGGSESTETAIKIARAYHRRNGEPGRYKVISRRNSYHGATGGVLAMAGSTSGDRSDYEPFYPGMIYAPQPSPYRCESGATNASDCAVYCAQQVEELIIAHNPGTIAAFIAEPVASNAGNAVPGDEYWPMIRDICDRYGVLLVSDEVICGYGRTGEWFGIQNWGVVPDVMGSAKGIVSSYMPFAAAVAKKEIADAFEGEDSYFRMANSFGGHPVAAAAALKNLEIIEEEGLVENSKRMGEYFPVAAQGASGGLCVHRQRARHRTDEYRRDGVRPRDEGRLRSRASGAGPSRRQVLRPRDDPQTGRPVPEHLAAALCNEPGHRRHREHLGRLFSGASCGSAATQGVIAYR